MGKRHPVERADLRGPPARADADLRAPIPRGILHPQHRGHPPGERTPRRSRHSGVHPPHRSAGQAVPALHVCGAEHERGAGGGTELDGQQRRQDGGVGGVLSYGAYLGKGASFGDVCGWDGADDALGGYESCDQSDFGFRELLGGCCQYFLPKSTVYRTCGRQPRSGSMIPPIHSNAHPLSSATTDRSMHL